MTHTIAVDWSILRGEDLSAFAASTNVQEISQSFVRHLAQHGTHDDFAAYINQQTNPIEKCFAVHYLFPAAAQAWLVAQLSTQSTPQSTANLHYHITEKIIGTVLPKKMFNHVDFTKMTEVQHKTLFFRLVCNNVHAKVVENWNVFEKICAKNPKDHYLYALSYGLDLGGHVVWSPKTSHERDQYFVACCTGGFLERVKKLRSTSQTMAVDAFAQTLKNRPPNAHEILEHVWTTHPNAPWHTQVLLRPLANFSLPLAKRLMEYYKTHDKKLYNSAALDLLEHAIETKNKDVVEFALPHIKPRDRVDMVVLATTIKHRPSIEIILASFKPQDHHKMLHWIPQEHKNMVNEILSQLQAKRIGEQLNSVTKSAIKRKM